MPTASSASTACVWTHYSSVSVSNPSSPPFLGPDSLLPSGQNAPSDGGTRANPVPAASPRAWLSLVAGPWRAPSQLPPALRASPSCCPLVQAATRTLCPWALSFGVSGFVAAGRVGSVAATNSGLSICLCFFVLFSLSLPLLHACWLPCSSLPPSFPPFLTTPIPPPAGSWGEPR